LIFLNYYEHFSISFISIAQHPFFRAKQDIVENGMMDLATTILARVLLILPFIFMGYVRSLVRRALKTAADKAI